MNFADKDRLSQLAFGALVRVELAEVAHRRAVDHATRSTRRIEPARQQTALRREGVVVNRARSKAAGKRFNRTLEIVEVDRARGVQAVAKPAGCAEHQRLRL